MGLPSNTIQLITLNRILKQKGIGLINKMINSAPLSQSEEKLKQTLEQVLILHRKQEQLLTKITGGR